MDKFLCIDIGGTAIKYGVLDECGLFLETAERPTQAWKGGKGILEKLKNIGDECLSKHNISGICISTAGMVDCEEGRITHSAPPIPVPIVKMCIRDSS